MYFQTLDTILEAFPQPKDEIKSNGITAHTQFSYISISISSSILTSASITCQASQASITDTVTDKGSDTSSFKIDILGSKHFPALCTWFTIIEASWFTLYAPLIRGRRLFEQIRYGLDLLFGGK